MDPPPKRRINRVNLTRRHLLAGSGATLVAAALPSASLAAPASLEARTARVQLASETYPATEIWGYDGRNPGPELRLRQGERLQRRLVNRLVQPTTIHWHGIRIDNAMDGVPGLTQQAVPPGQSFDYDFVAPDAGTYWYHAHQASAEQVARGLSGVLIVEETEAPEVDHDLALMLDDWRIDPATGQIADDFGNLHDLSHAGRYGNLVTTNGAFDFARDLRPKERLRLRLINAANARIFELGLSGLEGWVVALDGMPLPAPQPLTEALVLAPAQRADLIVDVTAKAGETAWLARAERDGAVGQARFPVAGTGTKARRDAPAPLPPNPRMEVTGLADARSISFRMEGGAMGRMQAAVLDGKRQSFRDLVQAGQFWAFNGVVGRTDAPLVTAARGETLRLPIVNDTAFPHAMHLHGHHFREVGADGALGPMRDTILVMSGETREIAFVADNPGDWLFHCHMLSHAAAGMTTWLRVAA